MATRLRPGDLTVNGVVEGAVLEVGGNLLISRGIQGHDDAHVSVDGNMVVNFINSANVCLAEILRQNSIMSSVVKMRWQCKACGQAGPAGWRRFDMQGQCRGQDHWF